MEQKELCYAETCLPRRKKVHNAFHSNSFRIFDESLPERLTPLSRYQNHTSPDPLRDLKVCERRNNPHPLNASFIRTNVRFLNEPVPHMENADQQASWWPSGCEAHAIEKRFPEDRRLMNEPETKLNRSDRNVKVINTYV